jgi:hypothetical protein
MERISRPYGASSETESSWPDDALSEAHSRYILSFMEQEQVRQQAVLTAFLADHPVGSVLVQRE